MSFTVPAAAGFALEVAALTDKGDSPQLLFRHDGASPRRYAMPMGDPKQIKPMEGLVGKPERWIPYPRPHDEAERRQRFLRRNEDAELAVLAQNFGRIVKLEAPGLDEFKTSMERKDYRGALEAYRRYFFDKLKSPENYGCPTQNLLFHFSLGRTREQLLKLADPEVVALNLRGVTVSLIEVPDLDGKGGRKECVAAEVGAPGAVWWAPVESPLPTGESFDMFGMRIASESPFWRSPKGQELQARLEVARALRYLPQLGAGWSSGGLFYPLYLSYVNGGDKAHLQRWCEYFDDYAMNASADYENSPVPIRLVTELETQQLQCMLTLLRLTIDTRPEFAEDFPASTLVRLVTVLARDYVPDLIRARRTEMANWGIMGLSNGIQAAEFFPELKAFDYWKREMWRLWRYNMIQHRHLDGETYESFDAGHKGIDVEYAWYALPFVSLPSDAHPLTAHTFWDHQRTMERSLLAHLSPRGNYWAGNLRVWDKSWAAERLKPGEHLNSYLGGHWLKYQLLEDIQNEPEAIWRISKGREAAKKSAPLPPPNHGTAAPRSTVLPYGATAYLRDSWAPDAPFISVRAFQDHSQTHPLASNFTLNVEDAALLSATPILVDRKPPNKILELNKVPTGGKVDFTGQAGRHVLPTRQHTSERFDLFENQFASPYSFYAYTDLLLPVSNDLIGHRHNGGRDLREEIASVAGVSARRQIIYIQGEKIAIVHDAILNRSGIARPLSQVFALSSAQPTISDPERNLLMTVNRDRANTAIRLLGRTPTWGGSISRDGSRFESFTPSGKNGINLVSAEWSGEFRQSVTSVINILPPARDGVDFHREDLRDVRELRGEGGVKGFTATTPKGATLWFIGGPEKINRLSSGPIEASGEIVLLLERNTELTGLVLGGGALRVHGRLYKGPSSDFEFRISATGELSAEPTHRPIDTVEISPRQTVFTDSATVSFSIPGHQDDDLEYRYTLDGTDPTLSSRRYTEPFAIAQTTLVKVRPFRKGLKVTPWNVPGTQAGKTVAALFEQTKLQPSKTVKGLQPGLNLQVHTGPWRELFAYAGSEDVLPAIYKTAVSSLLAPPDMSAAGGVERSHALVYNGYIEVPREGVYTLFPPENLLTANQDVGYDLRVFVNGHEWQPNPDLHAENAWSIALASGVHSLKVVYVNYRSQPFRNEFWMAWWPGQVGSELPVIDVEGPQLTRQPLPTAWLRRAGSLSN